jgi:hypothetical protein
VLDALPFFERLDLAARPRVGKARGIVEKDKAMPKRNIQQQHEPEGLVGFFGHTYIPDPDDADQKVLQYQFRIIRKMDATRYVIQYYSAWDGSPNILAVMTEADLLGEDVKLYPDAETWNAGYEAYNMRRR